MDQTSINEKKNVIIAYPIPKFGEALKKHFEAGGLKVLEVIVVIDHLFEKLEQLKMDGVPLHGLVISSDFATKNKEKRLEFLSNSIQKIREDFSDTSLIFLSGEKENHPLHAELVAMGIYNIFLRTSSDQLDVFQLIKCIDSPMPYSHTAKFRDFDKSIQWRRFVAGGQAINVTVESKRKEEAIGIQTQTQGKHTAVLERASTSVPDYQSETDYSNKVKSDTGIDTTRVEKIVQKTQVIEIKPNFDNVKIDFELPSILPITNTQMEVGTSESEGLEAIQGPLFIGVMSDGTDDEAINSAFFLASSLSKLGHKPLIAPENFSEIEAIERIAYQGEKDDPDAQIFESDGVAFIRHGVKWEFSELLTSGYSHIILLFGSLNGKVGRQGLEDWTRTQIPVLVTNGSRWKVDRIHNTLNAFSDPIRKRCKLLLLQAQSNVLRELENAYPELFIDTMPNFSDPFSPNEQSVLWVGNLLHAHRMRRIRGARWVITIATVLVFSGLAVWYGMHIQIPKVVGN